MVEMAMCGRGHRFSINRKKHMNRNYVICPHAGCFEQVQIRKHFFQPNPNWEAMKKAAEARRHEMKKAKKKHDARPTISIPRILPAGLMALSQLIMAREKEGKALKEKGE